MTVLGSLSVILITSCPFVWSSHYKLNRYYGNNINAAGTPSDTVILNSGECYSFPAWFGQSVEYFDGGWKVTCYDTIQADEYGIYQIAGDVQIQFVQNDGPSSYSCSAPTSTNEYDVYVPSIVYDTSPTTYSVYYWDSNTMAITQEFGSTSIECYEAAAPEESSGCPFAGASSRRRLDSSSDEFHTASFNVSVNIVLGAGVDPDEWVLSRFSANNFTNPWKALDNDMIPYLNNRGTSVEDGRRLGSGRCLVWGTACAAVALTVAAVGAATIVSGGALGVIAGSAGAAYGVSFTLQCLEGLISCAAASSVSLTNRLLTDSTLTEPTNFTLSFNYQVSTTLDSATARALFFDAIQSKLNTSILDGFPTFGTALSYNGSPPTNLTVSDVIVPNYVTSSDGSDKISTASIITIVCVLGGVVLLSLLVCLKRRLCPTNAAVIPTDEIGDQKLYV